MSDLLLAVCDNRQGGSIRGAHIDFSKTQNKFGGLPKDVARASGKFMEEWKTFYEKAQADGPKLEEVDVTSSIADVLSTKDERELVSSPVCYPEADSCHEVDAETLVTAICLC